MTTRSASGCRVDDAGRNAQFHLRPRTDFAPHRQLPSDQCGAFRHAAQTVVSLETLAGEHRRIDALSIVTHAQSELLVVVADLDLDPPGLRMPEGVPKCFRSNLVDLVTNDRVQISRLALRRRRGMREAGRALASVASSSPRVLIATARSLRSTVDARKPCTASRPSVIAFAACSNRTIQFLLRLRRALRQQVRSSLEPQQQTVEALQQRVVQLPGDPCALSDARLQRHLELRAAVAAHGTGRPPTATPGTGPRRERETSWSSTRGA